MVQTGLSKRGIQVAANFTHARSLGHKLANQKIVRLPVLANRPVRDKIRDSCIPGKILATPDMASVDAKELLVHTLAAILHDTTTEHVDLDAVFGYGTDASGSHHVHRHITTTSDQSHALLAVVNPLRITLRDRKDVVVWKNPRPGSRDFCRIQSLHRSSENKEIVRLVDN